MKNKPAIAILFLIVFVSYQVHHILHVAHHAREYHSPIPNERQAPEKGTSKFNTVYEQQHHCLICNLCEHNNLLGFRTLLKITFPYFPEISLSRHYFDFFKMMPMHYLLKGPTLRGPPYSMPVTSH